MTTKLAINGIVTTPNGQGRVVSTYYIGHETPYEPPEGILIKHGKDQTIDESKCAVVVARGSVSGWLCVYRADDILPLMAS